MVVRSSGAILSVSPVSTLPTHSDSQKAKWLSVRGVLSFRCIANRLSANTTMAPAASRMDQYFDDEEDDFMMRIVHNSCNGTAACSNSMSCQPALEHFDVLTVSVKERRKRFPHHCIPAALQSAVELFVVFSTTPDFYWRNATSRSLFTPTIL